MNFPLSTCGLASPAHLRELRCASISFLFCKEMAFSLGEHIGFTSMQVWCWLAAWMVWSARWRGGYRGWSECGRQSERKGWKAMNWKTACGYREEWRGKKESQVFLLSFHLLQGCREQKPITPVTGHEAGYTMVSSSQGWNIMANNHWNNLREPRQTRGGDAMNVLNLKKGQCGFLCRAQSYNTVVDCLFSKTFIVYASTFWPWLLTFYHWSLGPAILYSMLC